MAAPVKITNTKFHPNPFEGKVKRTNGPIRNCITEATKANEYPFFFFFYRVKVGKIVSNG